MINKKQVLDSIRRMYSGEYDEYRVYFEGCDGYVYSCKDPRDMDMFIAELKARIMMFPDAMVEPRIASPSVGCTAVDGGKP